jgi:hypothetical protein
LKKFEKKRAQSLPCFSPLAFKTKTTVMYICGGSYT